MTTYTFTTYGEIGKEIAIPTVMTHAYFGFKEFGGKTEEVLEKETCKVEIGKATLEKIEVGEKTMVIATPIEGELTTPVLLVEGGETAIITEFPETKVTATCEFYGEALEITYTIEIPEIEEEIEFYEKEELGVFEC